jgi:nickel transport protein
MAERAIAHGVLLEYEATSAYEIMATYDSGQPMAAAQVAVFSPDNPSEPWMTGMTDTEGRFLFSPPSPGNWEVQVRQAGHGDLVVVPVAETAIAAGATAPDAPAAEADTETAAEDAAAGTMVAQAPTASTRGSSDRTFTGLQKGLMAGSVVWGLVGTALFFSQQRPAKDR